MLTELECRGFRCLHDGRESFGQGRTLVVGSNGAGKSSLLEAAYIALTTRSFRTAQLKDCCREPESGFSVSAEVANGSRSRLEAGWDQGRRWCRRNGRRSNAGDHVKAQGVLLWSGERGDSFGLLPEHRRVLLDRGLLVEDPQALTAWKRFGKILRHKRELLVRGEGTQLPAWNRLFAEAGAALIARRSEYSRRLEEVLSGVVERTGLEWPRPRLAYRPSPLVGDQGVASLLDALEAIQGEEMRRARCLAGPQRDEVQFLWGGQEMRRVASQGERKSAGLLLLAAQGEMARSRGREPIYLLDDCDAELDRDRLERVWGAFQGASQLVATSNREEAWSRVDVELLRGLAKGRLEGL